MCIKSHTHSSLLHSFFFIRLTLYYLKLSREEFQPPSEWATEHNLLLLRPRAPPDVNMLHGVGVGVGVEVGVGDPRVDRDGDGDGDGYATIRMVNQLHTRLVERGNLLVEQGNRLAEQGDRLGRIELQVDRILQRLG
eukprot:GHVR01089689.1.p1 GENE.GHVR01089689.1~~GHVR01089689.1.p1  ORF type:complete len:137 (+),score=13.37 GHVR01089689.1:190-600(+)